MPFPYILIVEAYNEAGERVKLITNTKINASISGFGTYVKGEAATIFNPSDPGGNLLLNFPGIWTPDQMNVPGVDFAWDGSNDSGQDINQGVYFIKVSVTDEYGHVETIVKEVQLIKTEEYTRVSIYNGAGEIVSRIETPLVSGTVIDLSGLEDILFVGAGAAIPIKYGNAGQAVNWDGKNLDGKLVSNGVYEIVIEQKDGSGYKTAAAKTVTVLSEQGDSVLADPTGKLFPKTYPNPVITDGSVLNPTVAIDWYAAAPGEIVIKIYNIAGELVRRLDGDLNVKPVLWDLKEQSGQSVSSGLFLIVMQAKADDGRRETVSTKLAVLKLADYVTP